jgi:predicted dehydrogenase
MPKFKIGIIGLGVGEQHLKKYKELKECKVTLIFDKNIKKLKSISKKYGVDYCLNENEIFNSKEINVISIASYDHHHFSQASKAILNNKNLFIEKPAFLSFKESMKIKELLKKRNVGVYSNLVLRTSKRFMSLKKKIKKKKFGKIYYIEADYNYGRLNKIIKGWRSKIKDYSVTLGGGIHLIDLIIFLTNKKILKVRASGNKIVTGKKSSFRDFVSAEIIFDNNLIAKVNSNFGCVYPHFHKLNIYGSEKTFENHIDHERIYTKRDSKEFKKINSKYLPREKGGLIKYFLENLTTKKKKIKLINEMFKSLSVCYAIDESLKKKDYVNVKYIKV